MPLTTLISAVSLKSRTFKVMLLQIQEPCFRLATIRRKFLKIPYQDILYLEGKSNYTIIHLSNGNFKLSPRTLLYHVQNSVDDSFIRIHRAFCVNKFHIESTVLEEKTKTHVQLDNGKQLAISRRRRKNLPII